MSAFDRLLGLVVDILTLKDIFTLNPSDERQQLRDIMLSTTNITNRIDSVIEEIYNYPQPLSADNIDILYTIEQLSEQLSFLEQSQEHRNFQEITNNSRLSDGDRRHTISTIIRKNTRLINMLNIFIASYKNRYSLSYITPPHIKAAAAERAAIAIADRRRAMESQAAYIQRQGDVERASLLASLAAQAPANAAPGLAGVAPTRNLPPPFQLNPLADPFRSPAAAAAPQSIERVRNEDERDDFNGRVLQNPNPSNELVCPITQEIMFDPVVALDGRTYERRAIEMWLTTHSNSPMTKQDITDKTLRTNWAIRSAIERFLDGSLVKDMVGDSIEMLMKKINDGNDPDKKINKKDALVLLYDNDFNVQKAYTAYMMTQGGKERGGTRRNLRKKPRNQRKRYTKKRK